MGVSWHHFGKSSGAAPVIGLLLYLAHAAAGNLFPHMRCPSFVCTHDLELGKLPELCRRSRRKKYDLDPKCSRWGGVWTSIDRFLQHNESHVSLSTWSLLSITVGHRAMPKLGIKSGIKFIRFTCRMRNLSHIRVHFSETHKHSTDLPNVNYPPPNPYLSRLYAHRPTSSSRSEVRNGGIKVCVNRGFLSSSCSLGIRGGNSDKSIREGVSLCLEIGKAGLDSRCETICRELSLLSPDCCEGSLNCRWA